MVTSVAEAPGRLTQTFRVPIVGEKLGEEKGLLKHEVKSSVRRLPGQLDRVRTVLNVDLELSLAQSDQFLRILALLRWCSRRRRKKVKESQGEVCRGAAEHAVAENGYRQWRFAFNPNLQFARWLAASETASPQDGGFAGRFRTLSKYETEV
jgi:hypothetical protein